MINESNFHEVFARFEESGLTVKDFCSNELIAPSTFYYWRKKWHKIKLSHDFIPLVISSPRKITTTATSSDNESLFELVFPNGTKLLIKNNIDLAQLRTLIHLYD
jgi:hypothetical protein